MEKYKLFDAELKFMNIIWEEEPIKSGELVKVCNEKLGWKKSTTYTVLRKLAQRGVLKNENTVVTSIVKREDTQIYESHEVVEKSFGGSLPKFLTAFFGNKKISNDEAEELKKLIDSYKED
ncbi:BlaI/MecI/CopY family transcriptional regulator [Intestinibacter bartlettii]|uniref:BlaI/MecI/CopY family transcriptional regulator n=1 Tax=Intestinibacter bartlettii TaxID=261299 RepID=UPI0002EE6469|nr:BlaI/MecI/CopY family transcriptional regulator [Intestinibacter bartlettii]MCC2707149.1 BlaI/MecI/CopY family transcriptional regulator [Intestinibacter bartlettii]MCC2762598.1 BlaI/MecI/CopY family transcriptional regulator [Intestinibacter bartlettii]MDU2164061.1 BlaI/MecI/CopY family transcriptional regulator [Intestinibacter bartlettii]MDU6473699.1 BlaI/MecI/CopY family transcriptional regulator [Intestinibacter bartlettii]UWO81794.1 BlaI/MecI/CopY family transcriptional regulator [Int